MTHDYITFNQVIEDTDYGIIVNKEGMIKGIWIPEDLERDEIPATISRLCIEYFGVDPNDESNYQTPQ